MIKVVYATAQAMLELSDGTRVVIPKGSHWPADDPVVLERPNMFSADSRYGLLYTQEPDGWDAPVAEEATAVPGVRRNTRRG